MRFEWEWSTKEARKNCEQEKEDSILQNYVFIRQNLRPMSVTVPTHECELQVSPKVQKGELEEIKRSKRKKEKQDEKKQKKTSK